MMVEMFIIYDSKGGLYNKPFCFINRQVALRAAADLMADADSEIRRHPEDYSLWHIGQYDDVEGQIHLFEQRDCLVRFHEMPIPADEVLKQEN